MAARVRELPFICSLGSSTLRRLVEGRRRGELILWAEAVEDYEFYKLADECLVCFTFVLFQLKVDYSDQRVTPHNLSRCNISLRLYKTVLAVEICRFSYVVEALMHSDESSMCV